MEKQRTRKQRTEEATEEGSSPAGAPQPRLTGDLLTSSLLAFLRRWNAYGYQLVQSL